MKRARPGRGAFALGLALALPACMGGGDSAPDVGVTGATGTPATAVASGDPGPSDPPAQGAGDQIDVRRYIGPNYCPEVRVQPGAEMLRRYEAGHDADPASVVSQASIGKTARECLYDLQGNLTLKIGVSGRVVAGPNGGPSTVRVPLRIAVVRYQEATLASQAYPFDIAIPAIGSATFSQVHEVNVPSPGKSRNYIVYVGLAETEEDLLEPGKKAAEAAAKAAAAQAAAKEAADRAAERAAEQASRPPPKRRIIRRPAPAQGPANVLPVPEGYGAPSG